MSELQLAVISAADNSRIDNNDNNNLPASSPPSYSVQNVACPIDEDEVAIEAFRKRYGANKLPDEHVGEWTAKNADLPKCPFAGDPIHYAPNTKPHKGSITFGCGISCSVM